MIGQIISSNYLRSMTENSASHEIARRPALGWAIRNSKATVAAGLVALVVVCAISLEARFFGLETTRVQIGQTPVTLYRLPGAEPAPAVVVAHGFAGSRQMMDQISVSLARQGFVVASMDFPGHGRHRGRLSPDITNLDGTTTQLIDAVMQVADAISVRSDTTGGVSFVGHSMASDIVIRTAQARDDVAGVVAISMYSTAHTDADPAALLVLSGAMEQRLRDGGLAALWQIDPDAGEGQTVTEGDLIRRSAVAPFVGHVGVLYSTTSLAEITDWLRLSTGAGRAAALDRSGWIAGVMLVGLLLLIWPLSKFMPTRDVQPQAQVQRRAFLACLILPIPLALLIAMLPILGIASHAAFGSLAVIFGAWGLVQIAILRAAGARLDAPDVAGTVFYLGAALLFALALDRYGAAFLPTGDRAIILAGLLPGAFCFMIADAMLLRGASFLRRLLARLSFILALCGAMLLAPTELGLTFTTLPVLILFFLVYGTMAHWIGARRGSGLSLGKAVVLAWSIAASTPLFAVGSLS